MPAGSKLSEEEQGMILALKDVGKGLREIERLIGRSRGAITLFLKDTAAYNTKKRTGRPPKVTRTDIRRLIRTASNSFLSSRELVAQCQLTIKARRARQLLATCEHLKFVKAKATPVLTEKHKKARLQWSRDMLVQGADIWTQVVFSDEKKFNLDGPDGLKHYWHDLRKEKAIFSRRQSGGGSIMVWGAFCAKGKTELAFLDGAQDSGAYIGTLSNYLFPFIDYNYGRDCVFQHDNASIHASRETKAFLSDHGVRVMEWPAKSPDLNPIENMWGILARAVYAHGRQFATKIDLVAAISKAWDEVAQNLIENLLKSMPNRCMSVLELKGGKTKY
ncbi:hypothetical protein AaE_012778 [Aphanomyces astaci]|uniref:Tc1-like transposase DDE domain-containing protein n=1 Tax=Aphanomyces astaci TaxID=112090 RepID=A0A6A4Z9M4_APHAT|nr:hypothetical protein AaE_012778 [Aphanomyces astaci]